MELAASQNEKTETDKRRMNRHVCSKDHAISFKEVIQILQTIERIFDSRSELSDKKRKDILEVTTFLQRFTSIEAVQQVSLMSNLITQEKIVEVMFKLLDRIYDGDIKNKPTEVGINALRNIQAFTACSEKLCKVVCENSLFFVTMKKVLENPKDIDSLSEVLLVLRNIILRESCVSYVREVPDIVKTLTSCLKSDTIKDVYRFCKITILAAIINYNELATVDIDDNLLQTCLVEPFRKCLVKNELKTSLCSCTDLTIIIRMLAKNKANSQRLGKVCLELLVEFEEKAKTNEEKLECVKAILALASDPDNRKTMVTESQLCVIDRILQLKKSDLKDCKKMKKICNIILWKLREELFDSETHKELGASCYKNGKKNTVKKEHIMLSYQRDNKNTVIEIKTKLEEGGHKVWMYTGNVEGGDSRLKAMAYAVENARIVLICITKKYEDSTNCKLEIEYALKLEKRIIPLKLERQYQTRGLVGLNVETRSFIEITDISQFVTGMPGLLINGAKVILNQRHLADVKTQTQVLTVAEMETQTQVLIATEVETQTQVLTATEVETQTQVLTGTDVSTQTVTEAKTETVTQKITQICFICFHLLHVVPLVQQGTRAFFMYISLGTFLQ